MAVVEIYSGEPCILEVLFTGNPLTPYNKDYPDIEEIYMGLKQTADDADDAYAFRHYKDGLGLGAPTGDVLYDGGTHSFKLVLDDNWSAEEGNYFVATGVKVAGYSKMIWLRQLQDRDNVIKIQVDAVKK